MYYVSIMDFCFLIFCSVRKYVSNNIFGKMNLKFYIEKALRKSNSIFCKLNGLITIIISNII